MSFVANLLIGASVISFLVFLGSLLALISRSKRRLALRLAAGGFVGFFVAGFGSLPFFERAARDAGYASYGAQKQAERDKERALVEAANRAEAQAEDQRKAQRAADAAKRLADLKAKLPGAARLSASGQYAVYNELADLDPKTNEYQQKRDQLKPLAAIEENQKQIRIAEALQATEKPEEFLKIERFSWSKAGFGAIMVGNFVIKNISPMDIKDFTIRCTDSAPSGTVVDHNEQTIYDVVKAHSEKTFRNINMGFIYSQASNSGCEVVRAAAAGSLR